MSIQRPSRVAEILLDELPANVRVAILKIARELNKPPLYKPRKVGGPGYCRHLPRLTHPGMTVIIPIRTKNQARSCRRSISAWKAKWNPSASYSVKLQRDVHDNMSLLVTRTR